MTTSDFRFNIDTAMHSRVGPQGERTAARKPSTAPKAVTGPLKRAPWRRWGHGGEGGGRVEEGQSWIGKNPDNRAGTNEKKRLWFQWGIVIGVGVENMS